MIQEYGIDHKNLRSILEEHYLSEKKVDAEELRSKLSKFISKVKDKIKKHNRVYERVFVLEAEWLECEFLVNAVIQPGPGRPNILFCDLSGQKEGKCHH